jgi:hypothetical protein
MSYVENLSPDRQFHPKEENQLRYTTSVSWAQAQPSANFPSYFSS